MIAICLLIRAIFRLSYRSVYSFLASSNEYSGICRINRLPAHNTAQGHVKHVSEGYLNELVRQASAAIMRVQRTDACSSACDGTGVAIRKYERRFNARNSSRRRKRSFVKLHAHLTRTSTSSAWPLHGTYSQSSTTAIRRETTLDNPSVAHSIDQKPPEIAFNKEQYGPSTDYEPPKPAR